MRRKRHVARVVTVGWVLSCSVLWAEEVTTAGRDTADGEELLQVDRAFAEAVEERGLEAWVEAFASDGMMLPAAGEVVNGTEAIREAMAPAFANPEFRLTWSPLGGGVGTAGDLGYTYGTYESFDGSSEPTRGKYVTIWKRGEGGTWRVVLDIGNREPKAAP
jgi:ketosteroid isomerase-like protein